MALKFACPACGQVTQAPDEMAGKRAKCPHCLAVIEVPRPADAAEIVPVLVAAPTEPDPMPAPTAPTAAAELARRPCSMCGEMIVETALKCRFCGQRFVWEPDRTRNTDVDAKLEAGDYVILFVPCLSVVGCIVGIVYLIQGRPKASRMITLAIAMTVAWWLFATVIAAMQDGRRARRFSEHRPVPRWHGPAAAPVGG